MSVVVLILLLVCLAALIVSWYFSLLFLEVIFEPSFFKILLFPGLPLSLLTRENSDLCFLAASCVKLNPWKGSFPGGEVLLLRARVEDKCEMDV